LPDFFPTTTTTTNNCELSVAAGYTGAVC
jgi:hypothetical protein